MTVAHAVKASGANLLRGGAFKPRTSPYSFQGMRAEGIELLLEAKKETGLPIVTEIMSLAHLDLFNDVDVIQVGAGLFDFVWLRHDEYAPIHFFLWRQMFVYDFDVWAFAAALVAFFGRVVTVFEGAQSIS